MACDPARRRGFLRKLGPALIVGSVVLGPGSILTASRVGCDFAYELVWIVVVAAVLMAGMCALSARLGATLEGTLCEELQRRAGRPLTAFVGIVLFLVVACFQFSNNIGVLAAVTPFVAGRGAWPVILLLLLNLLVIAALFGLRRLYRPVEVAMKILLGLMVLGFAGNLFLAAPDPLAFLGGLVPGLPAGASADLLPRLEEGRLRDALLPVQGLLGTTFSVAAAFYLAYLVRAKGWGLGELRRGFADTLAGISILGLLTLVILTSAAAMLHGRVAGAELGSAADVASVLEPLFGRGAKLLFCTGLLAGAFSSFLVNAMIGGAVLSDSLGLGGGIDQPWPRRFTVVALLAGMAVAIEVQASGAPPVPLIIFAQALTVLGNPILAAALLWISWRRAPRWLLALGSAGFALVLFLALRTGVRLWLVL